MQKADLLTLIGRIFASLTLLVIAGIYASRREWVPTVLFTVLSAVVSTLAAGLLRKNRIERETKRQPGEKP
jgi:hypothetical protein